MKFKLTWNIMVLGFCGLWFVSQAGAVPLESWDSKIQNSSQRFKVLADFGGTAVLDMETKLVWERSPSTTGGSWSVALGMCINKNVGGRFGWRLPAIPELASLIDPSVIGAGPTLPPGHPFQNVVATGYWSATTLSYMSTHAWTVIFRSGDFGGVSPDLKDLGAGVWCVRGGMNDAQY